MTNTTLRNDWSIQEIENIYHQPLLELVYQAATVHRVWHKASEVQVCTLLSVKTGGCPEDCSYCGQAARYHTGITVKALMDKDDVVAIAQRAKDAGSSRFCMAAAWREVRDNRDFDKIIEMVKGVNEIGLEVCCTLGMINEAQAERLQEAGLYAYNHNLDSSKEYYQEIISTRTYDDRLTTLNNVRKAGISVCSGGIIGLGETHEDRIRMLHTLSNLEQHPESVPVNALARVKGTPLADLPKVDTWEMVRMIATARILMPKAMVRLSAGRAEMTTEEQSWCFMAGANSIFTSESEEMLVTPNPKLDDDRRMFELLGLKPMQKDRNSASTVNI
ncbi:biotin synthase [Pedobacter sp. PACM 27299]|uniref:biotin synthase BioB n=1 Tax=Pedobacter sp. PACM 27299 TaxID=1727164 RepID=UPI000705702F|nr:biotin synthase BioB [Pedobacter sp. PACM 27299]ALL05976.1 biotin synthase [Pedobacter sp. PACM 27299]